MLLLNRLTVSLLIPLVLAVCFRAAIVRGQAENTTGFVLFSPCRKLFREYVWERLLNEKRDSNPCRNTC